MRQKAPSSESGEIDDEERKENGTDEETEENNLVHMKIVSKVSLEHNMGLLQKLMESETNEDH